MEIYVVGRLEATYLLLHQAFFPLITILVILDSDNSSPYAQFYRQSGNSSR